MTRGGTRRAPPDAPRQPAATVARPEPPRPSQPAVVVRGVTDDGITLGMSAAFSGASRELGSRMKLGLDTAFAVANAAGGVAGRAVHLLALDDGYEGPRALANVKDLIDERKVFAIIGDVGTPTTQQALPYVLDNKTIFFGAFTGSGRAAPRSAGSLRVQLPGELRGGDRPDDRLPGRRREASPTAGSRCSPRTTATATPGSTARPRCCAGGGATTRCCGSATTATRSTSTPRSARLVEYHDATARTAGELRPRHPVKAIILVATYKAAARFIQRIRDRKIDALLLNVSFVGSNSLAEELRELGPSYAQGVIVTQVVPHYESDATGVLRFRDALRAYHPDQQPDFVSLEGFLVGELFVEGLRRAGRDVDTEKLVDALEQLHDVDLGIAGDLGFSSSRHQASHRVWGTQLDDHGAFRSIDME